MGVHANRDASACGHDHVREAARPSAGVDLCEIED